MGGPYGAKHSRGPKEANVALDPCHKSEFIFVGEAPKLSSDFMKFDYVFYVQGIDVPENKEELKTDEAKEVADAVSTNPTGIADKRKEALDSAFTGTGVEAPKSDGFSGIEPSKEDSALMHASAKCRGFARANSSFK